MAGQDQQALNAFSQAVNGDPRPGYAHAALVALLESYIEVNEYQRGLIDYHAGSYGAAVSAFYRYIEITPDYNSDAHYYVALSYFNSGSFDLALQECERALAKFPDTIQHWGEIWLLKARVLARQDRIDDAVGAYTDFASTYAAHPLAAQALWETAWLLERAERFTEAADLYTLLADKYLNDDKAPAARFRAGICHYRDGDSDAAMIAWKELVNGYPGSSESLPGRYWLGKVLWSQGEMQEARELLQSLATTYPRNYYGLRAAHLLTNNGLPIAWPETPAPIHQASDEQAEKTKAAAWLRTWTVVPESIDLSALSGTTANEVHLRRGMELLTLGLHDQAREEFEALRREVGQDPLALLQLALLTRDLGMYAPSLRATIDLITIAPESSVLDMPLLVQRLAFPVYYDDLVRAECAAYDLDPLLMFALIRQESVFDDKVASWAGAVGLAQIMPSTGKWIAEMMPWPQYQEDDLRRAYLNVRFGTWFLDRILEQADGDVMTALAGYNGGPVNSMRWLEQSGGDPDLFVEVIHRDEPRRYVRQIYRHYDVYVRLYGN
jgi:soluble lytic murein transglycosylase